MTENQGNQDNWLTPRVFIAIGVILISIVMIGWLAYVVLSTATENKLETAKTVFATVLPLLATWVGTIIAFYFSRDNFESANRNVREMVSKVTSLQKLQSTSVETAMIPIKDIVYVQMTPQKAPAQLKLVEDLLKLLNDKNRNRLPIFDEHGKAKYVIHRSLIDRFLTYKSIAGASVADLNNLTLKDLIEANVEEVKKFLRVSFGTVKATDNLADAKREMDRENGRLDVLVTNDGTANSPVVGWITNLIINDHATV